MQITTTHTHTCDECYGSGHDRFDHPCVYCEGTGRVATVEHDSHTCTLDNGGPCEMCRWANRIEKERALPATLEDK